MTDATEDLAHSDTGKDLSATLRKMLRAPKGVRGRVDLSLERVTDEIFRKTAKDFLKLDLVVDEISVVRKSLADALAGRPAICLTMSTMRSDGQAGMFILDGALIDGLIEQQLLGNVARAPRVDRPVTRIDAELCRGFATEILKGFTKVLSQESHTASVCGFGGPVMVTDITSLQLSMTASAYTVLCVFLDLGPGQKSGQAQLWFPALQTQEVDPGPPRDAAWIATLNKKIAEAQLSVKAFLPVLKVPLSVAMNLKEGESLSVPLEALSRAVLKDVKGNKLATGRIGQLRGSRAFRIESSVFKTFEALAEKPQTSFSPPEPSIATPTKEADPSGQDLPSLAGASDPFVTG